jgi:RNA polymerase sigma-70 factor (ECF subfamily)
MTVAPMAEWRGEPGPGTRPAVAGVLRTAETYEAFFRREHPRIVALAIAICGPARAEDVAQEALLRAHRHWSRLCGYDKPGAWVRRVAVNLAISARRRAGNEGSALRRLAGRPDRQLVLPPEVDDLWEHVRALPAQQAAALALHYLDDLPVAAIAEALDCAEGTAKVHLHKGRRALAARLGEQAGDDEEER